MKDLKKLGKMFISQGYFLGDTSGKTKKLKEKSVFAICSLKREYSIKFESTEKEKIYAQLIKKYSFGYEKVNTLMHAVKIYYATKEFIDSTPGFYICCDGFNKMELTKQVQRLFQDKWDSKKFNFAPSLKSMFGKYNLADRLAYNVNKNCRRANIILKESHFKKLKII